MLIATKSSKIELSTEKKTAELASIFFKKLKIGNVVFLHGEMGVGKTTFIRYLINIFQKENEINQTEVTSPTFNLLNEYQINKIKINHYDLFRLKSIEEIQDLGLTENHSNSITLIEWPQMIKEKPKNLIELYFEYGEDHITRSVQIEGLDLKS